MCGRAYSTYTDEEIAIRYLNKRSWPWREEGATPKVKPNFNLCPTQTTSVLNVEDNKIGLRPMRWGLVPAWAKSVKDADKYSLINAKSEEITEKRSYKNAFQKRRCIVPLSGFFEWKRSKDGKRPFAISLKDDAIMSLAGIWEHWEDKDSGTALSSFSLLTTSANTFMKNIHDRMPVILKKDDEQLWLDPSVNDPEKLAHIMRPCPSEWLIAQEVSTLVNSPKNNGPAVLRAV